MAINLSPEGLIRYYSPFPEAIPYQRVYSHALLTRPPLTPKGALDLHVLGLPPAFVLSQDQTLKLKSTYMLILDVRTSAHLWLCYHPLGYLSTRQLALPLRYLSAIKRHPQPASREYNQKSSVCMCLGFHQKPKAVQTVKLTLDHRAETLLARYTDIQSVENEPNRPHISSVIHQCQRTNIKDPKPDHHAKLSAQPPNQNLRCSQSFLSVPTVSPACPTVSPARHHRLTSAGEGGSKFNRIRPQAEKYRNLQKTADCILFHIKQ